MSTLATSAPPRWPRLGPYLVIERLGGGGYGEVYRAVREADQQVVALKVLRPNPEQEQDVRRRFQVEGHLAMGVENPHVVKYVDVGEEAGILYLAMEVVAGGDAGVLPAQHQGRVPAELIATIGRDAALGLAALHERGLLHRDIKPSNLFLTSDGRCKVGDLGLVIQLGDASSITLAGNVVGTPDYIAPEQARDDQDLDHRADLFSLAASLYFLAVGRAPFQAATIWTTLTRLMSEPFPDPRRLRPDLDPQLAAVILMAGDKEPANRHGTALEMAADLEAVRCGRARTVRDRSRPLPVQVSERHVASGPRILLIDDDPLIRRIHASRLRMDGFRVDTAADGTAALATALANPPDAVVLDLMLGEADGVEVLRRLRARPELVGVPVVVFSGSFEESHLRRAREVGADLILAKSATTPKDLSQRLRTLVNGTESVRRSGRTSELPPVELAAIGGQALARIARLVSALGGSDEAAQHQALTEIASAASGLAGMAGAAGSAGTALLAEATAELANQLRSRPGRVTASSRHTLGQALAGLHRLVNAQGLDWTPQPTLVVDDDPGALRLAAAALGKVKIPTTTCLDPLAAVELAKTTHFALIVTDVMMDGCPGQELATRIRSGPVNARVPVIYVTALADFARHLAASPGANRPGQTDDSIAKPYLVMELAVKALVHQVCGRAQPSPIRVG